MANCHPVLFHDTALGNNDKGTICETSELRAKNSKIALDKLGWKVKIVNGLPIPDLD